MPLSGHLRFAALLYCVALTLRLNCCLCTMFGPCCMFWSAAKWVHGAENTGNGKEDFKCAHGQAPYRPAVLWAFLSRGKAWLAKFQIISWRAFSCEHGPHVCRCVVGHSGEPDLEHSTECSICTWQTCALFVATSLSAVLAQPRAA
jgi:hypothetical protein